MTGDTETVWQWSNTDFEWDREEEQALVGLHGGSIQRGKIGDIESCSCQISIPWRENRSEKVARLDALKRLRTLIDAEIRALESPSAPRDD